MKRKYKTGGARTWPRKQQAQTQKDDTTNQYTSGIKKTTINNTTADNLANPCVDAK